MKETVTIIALIGAALNAGVFFTFSTFTMQGLRRLAPAAGAAAMQEINREAPRPPLMIVMFGTAMLTTALMVNAVANIEETTAWLHLVAGAVFLLGVILMTGMYHVPRNNRLDRLDPESRDGIAYWAVYYREWVRMNHVRMLAPAATAVLLAVSI